MKTIDMSLATVCTGLLAFACSPAPASPGAVDGGAMDAGASADAPWQSLTLCPAPHTLGYHLATSADPTSFSYDPAGSLVADITGNYQPDTGAFAWTVTYHPDHPRMMTEVRGELIGSGEQYVASYTRTTHYRDGTMHAEEVDENWLACTVDRRTRDVAINSAWWFHAGSSDGAVYSYTDTKHSAYSAVTYEFTGTIEADLSWRERHAYFDPFPEFEEIHEGDADGWLRWSYDDDEGNSAAHFLDEWQLDGSHYYYSRVSSDGDGCEALRWHDITVDGDGFGGGQATYCDYTSDPVFGTRFECDVTIAPGSCALTCPDGPTATCDWE